MARAALDNTNEQQQVARPLSILVPLIQDDLQQGREAAARAGLPHYRAAGEKMLEAKTQIAHGQFRAWVTLTFGISYSHAHRYMQLAKTSHAGDFSSLSDFIRKTSSPTHHRRDPVRTQARQAERESETLNRLLGPDVDPAEREKQRTLGLRLIDIGYKVLARELHPDTGGSPEAMTRLNAERIWLKQWA